MSTEHVRVRDEPDVRAQSEPDVRAESEPDVAVKDEAGLRVADETVAVPSGQLWPDGLAEALRERWRERQLQFVDDPQSATARADELLDATIAELTESLQAQRAELAQWRNASDSDTEGLRMAMQRYRGFLDRVLTM